MRSFHDLARLLPHSPPFRLIDRVAAADPALGTLTALRLVTADDPLLPPEGRLPETLVIEALCQAAACLNGLGAETGSVPYRGYLVAVTGFRFHGDVQAGETLSLAVSRQGCAGSATAFSAEASALPPHPRPLSRERERGDGRPVASGRLLFTVSTP